MNQKQWIWQHDEYPNFQYDLNQINQLLVTVAQKTGIIRGKLDFLNDSLKNEIMIESASSEIEASSSIEGEILKRESVRSSLRKRLDNKFEYNEDVSIKHTDNLAAVYIDVNNNYEDLTIDRLHGWHHALFEYGFSGIEKINKGAFRNYDEMYIVSGEGTRQRIHYVALPHDKINDNIKALLHYCNTSKDNPFIKSAIAHVWFESIHPYDDGNGRIGRAITNHVLSKELGLDNQYYSISYSINADRKGYYKTLENTNRLTVNKNFDITDWIKWHTSAIEKAIDISLNNIDQAIQKTKFYDRIKEISLNDNQRRVVNILVKNPQPLNNERYRQFTGTSQVTASRHIRDLVKKKILYETKGQGGRSTSYQLAFDRG